MGFLDSLTGLSRERAEKIIDVLRDAPHTEGCPKILLNEEEKSEEIRQLLEVITKDAAIAADEWEAKGNPKYLQGFLDCMFGNLSTLYELSKSLGDSYPFIACSNIRNYGLYLSKEGE